MTQEITIVGLIDGSDYFYQSKQGNLILKTKKSKDALDLAWADQAWPFKQIMRLKPNNRDSLVVSLDPSDPDICYVHQILQVYASKII